MKRFPIPTALLVITTTACTKSNEDIAEDLCTLTIECGSYQGYSADEIAPYISECETATISELEEDECARELRSYYTCISNLSCSDVKEWYEGDIEFCTTEYDAWLDC